MLCFRIPTTIIGELKRLIASYWWGANFSRTKIHWKTWPKLLLPKNEGGLGFRDLTLFNKALLAKQVWRMVENPDHLVTRVFKARYFKHTDVMEATLRSNPSYIWRSLLWSRNILQNGILWKVRNGESIKAIDDAWIPELHTERITSSVIHDNNIRVNSPNPPAQQMGPQ